MQITEIRMKINLFFYHLRHTNFPDGNIRDFSLFSQHVWRHPRQEVQNLQRGLLHPAPQGDDEILKKDAGTQKNAGAIEKWEQLVKKKVFNIENFYRGHLMVLQLQYRPIKQCCGSGFGGSVFCY
jgi:hypothetical protein